MAKKDLALDAWVGWIATLLGLDQGDSFKLNPATAGGFHLSETPRKPQAGHNNMCLEEFSSLVCFVIVIESENDMLYTCKGSLYFLVRSIAENGRKEIF